MSRQFHRLRRPLLVALYLALLGVWATLTFDTYGIWLGRQQAIAHGLAEAAIRPTPEPTFTPLPMTATPTGGATQAAPVLAEARPTATPPPPAVVHPKTGRYIAAWLPTSFDKDQARASFEANKDILDEISPFWYSANPANGQLAPEEGARDRGLIEAAQEANVLVIPTVHNVEDPSAILPLLRDPERRKQHIAVIMDEVRTFGYDGFDIDYETLPPDVRPAYSDFMRELGAALHAEGKLLTVAVHAKSTDDGGLGGFQDWKLLGEVCDRVRIMTYDFHWRGGGPGPIAPLSWVAEVSEYARTVVPAAKVQVGVPFYAYNWGRGSEALAQTWTEVQQLIDLHKPEVNLQERDASGPVEESWFTYRDGRDVRTVWFASYRALQAKLELVQEQDLGGVAIWRLGNEDPRNWNVVRKQLVDNPGVIQRVIDTYLPDH